MNVGVRQEDVEARRALNWMRPTETSFSEPHLFDLGLDDAEVGEMAQQFAAMRRDAPEYKTSFREYLKRQYGGRYRDSNRELAELSGRDVAALGYEV